PQTRLHPTGDAPTFIADLYAHYIAAKPKRTPAVSAVPQNYQRPPAEPPPHAAFISYAREDVAAARKLYMDLLNAGVTSWLDEERLETGDAYRSKIFRAIDSARAFIP